MGDVAAEPAVITRESRRSCPEAPGTGRDAAAYWIARSSRAMTTQWLIIHGRAVGKLFAPLPGVSSSTAPASCWNNSRSPGPCEALYWAGTLRRVGAALIGGEGLAPVRGHAEIGAVRITRGDSLSQCGQSCGGYAHSAIGRMSVERAAIVAEIFIDGHFGSSRDRPSDNPPTAALRGGKAGASRLGGIIVSIICLWEIGIWMSPLMCLIGPADDGMMSKSKNLRRQPQRGAGMGTSTTPEMWPWHGAVPRIE